MSEKTGRILIIDDDEGILLTLRILLRKHFAEVVTEMTPQKITHLLSQQHFHVVMLDMNFAVGATNGKEGFHWLKTVKEQCPESEVVMMTAYADIDLAIKAIKEGAMDFVIKPWDNDKLLGTISDAFKKSQMAVASTGNLVSTNGKAEEVSRIFMFLDIKSSTSIAESLGHFRYFELLNDFFSDISETIVNHQGEIYQYVGDEVVVSWSLDNGLEQARCLDCFFHIIDEMEQHRDRYERKYGLLPEFKAGLHYGTVTSGTMGTVKKETVFSGEVLAITSRIEGLCNRYKVNLLLSEELLGILPLGEEHEAVRIDNITLRGKQEPMTLFSINRLKIA